LGKTEPNIDVSLLELVTLASPHIAGYSLDGKVNALSMNYEAVCSFLGIDANLDVHSFVANPSTPPLPDIKLDQSKVQKRN